MNMKDETDISEDEFLSEVYGDWLPIAKVLAEALATDDKGPEEWLEWAKAVSS